MFEWHPRSLARNEIKSAGFVEPCRPVSWDTVPTGSDWLHELKYDGWRVLARKEGDRVKLWSRKGRDWTRAFPGVARAIGLLSCHSCVVDGEALAGWTGWPRFRALRSSLNSETTCLMAFDLLELDGADVRPWPLIARRERLEAIVDQATGELWFSEHISDGSALFRYASSIGLEGIVSKRTHSRYVPGRYEGWRTITCAGHAR
jgi:bifunctional non-homologous end joining protein LigD